VTETVNRMKHDFMPKGKWLWVVCCVLISLPLLYPIVPPFTDVYGHMGRYHVQLNGTEIPILSEWYRFTWALVPNLGHDILTQIFAPWLGIERTTKYLIIATQIIGVIGVLWVSKTVHGSVQFTAILALPFLYHYAFLYGFLNFSLSLGLALCGFAFWLNLHRRPRLRQFLFLIISVLVFICHIYGWAVMCILIGSHMLVRHIESEEGLFDIVWKTSRACLVLTFPFSMYYSVLSGSYESGERMIIYKSIGSKLGYLIMVLRDRWMIWDILSVVGVFGFIVFAARSSAFLFAARSSAFHKDKGLVLAVLICLALYIIMPSTLLGSAFADMRLVPIIFMIGLLMIRPSQRIGANVMAIALIFLGLRIGGNMISTTLYENDVRREYSVLDKVPDNSRLVTFVGRACKGEAPWTKPRQDHLPSLALVRKNTFANDQWTTAGGHLIHVIIENAGPYRADPTFKTYPTRCTGKHPDLAGAAALIPAGGFEYLWAINDFGETPGEDWSEISHNSTSSLYRYVGGDR